MSYDVWLFAPTYACISTKLCLYLVNKALSLHNILVFSFHAYRTRQMSMNGGTKNNILWQKVWMCNVDYISFHDIIAKRLFSPSLFAPLHANVRQKFALDGIVQLNAFTWTSQIDKRVHIFKRQYICWIKSDKWKQHRLPPTARRTRCLILRQVNLQLWAMFDCKPSLSPMFIGQESLFKTLFK